MSLSYLSFFVKKKSGKQHRQCNVNRRLAHLLVHLFDLSKFRTWHVFYMTCFYVRIVIVIFLLIKPGLAFVLKKFNNFFFFFLAVCRRKWGAR